jgi:hypothetical protein
MTSKVVLLNALKYAVPHFTAVSVFEENCQQFTT